MFAAAVAAAFAVAAPAVVETDDGYTAHEWGTFNQMEGADGVDVDGLQHEDEALPEFVARRLPRTPSPLRVYGDDASIVRAHHANTKMETPVIYFHSRTARRVHVDVTWNGGLLSEWYPRASLALPEGPVVDVKSIRSSRLAWDIDVLGPDAQRTLQAVDAGEPWALARDVDANLVEPYSPIGASHEAERYIFYRGIGAQPVDTHVFAYPEGRLVVANTEFAVLLENGPSVGGFDSRIAIIGALHGGKMVQTSELVAMPKEQATAKLAAALEHALVAQGLNDDEAHAMVATWSRTWFDRPGRRLLTIVPKDVVDARLPLTLSPAPKELVRVFVSRLEYTTAQDIDALVRAAVADDAVALAKHGRFLEPKLRIALACPEYDAKQKAALRRVLATLAE